MNEHSHAIDIAAPADAVFEFLSDVSNMPAYLPTTHHAEMTGKDRVRMKGEARGHAYDAEGWLHMDAAKHRMEWGADGDRKYQGRLEVRDMGADRCNVAVHIQFDLSDQERASMEQTPGGADGALTRGIQASLESIRNLCEGKGGKVEPPEAT